MKKCEYKRFTRTGPGGRKCSCCYPPPGKFRRYAERQFKKKEREFIRELIREELNTPS